MAEALAVEGSKLKKRAAIAEAVRQVAGRIGRTPSQVALAWLRQQKQVIPIIGARKVSQLKDNLGCLGFTLALEDLRQLNEVSKIELGFPHEFLARDMIRDIVHGGTYGQIDPS